VDAGVHHVFYSAGTLAWVLSLAGPSPAVGGLSSLAHPPPKSTLFPYTTLFRSLAESKVRTVFDDTNLWIILADEFGRSISGTVVGNDDLKLCGARSSIDGTQTLANRFPIVPADGYDG